MCSLEGVNEEVWPAFGYMCFIWLIREFMICTVNWYTRQKHFTTLLFNSSQKTSFCLFESVFRIRIHLIRIRIQHIRLNTNPDPDPIRISNFDDKKIDRIKYFLDQKLQFPIDQKLQISYP
jgi:hypothetical protein